ncbi:MAG TPA: ubiquinone biosynthesis regulatory protein kinase UbiB [Xanthomonadaceae bacterium]|nr:ubiquinone biosynthesis regulatory protein kinase UbiB [Xanthomonadaceae bacterium]
MQTPLRILQIARVALRYRLDALAAGTRFGGLLRLLRPFVPRAAREAGALPRGARVRLALQALGPLFVKFGQILSTRRDLLPLDVAEELTLLQDQVAPFPGEQAQALVEQALGRPIGELFGHFERTPLASASVAQVHAATLPDGREVVVKVLRPGIGRAIDSDLDLLRTLARLAQRIGPDPERVRPGEIVDEIERSLTHELDLQREGANASLLRRNFLGSADLYVPLVHWTHSAQSVLTMERVHGIPSDDIAALDAARIDRVRLAEKGVRLFYTQVFRDNFFHADAHAGNIWVDPERREDPRFIALDFGIMGSLPDVDRYYLAENFTAMFEQNYRRIAELHIEAGWMPATLRLDELEAAVRTVCEPYFTRPLSEIALGEVLLKLFKVAHQFQLTIQPQLILLQKTLLNIEGLGRLLHPKIDIFATARPVLAEILRRERSPQAVARLVRQRLPGWLAAAPDMPQLLHDYLKQAVTGQMDLRLRSRDLERLAEVSHAGQRQSVFAILGAALWIVAAVLYGLGAGGPTLAGLPLPVWLAGLGGIGAFAAAWPRPH